jgi:hypothetical protein
LIETKHQRRVEGARFLSGNETERGHALGKAEAEAGRVRQRKISMWFADVVLDLQWFIASEGKLGEPKGRTTTPVSDPEALTVEILLYGDDEAIKHLRLMIHTDEDAKANACVDHNIQNWIASLEVASALATPKIASAARLQKNSASFMVLVGQGDANTPALMLNLEYTPAAKADLSNAAKLMASWKPDFKFHLHYISRFLNHDLLPEVRWLNGYRALEWHFLRGKSGLASHRSYRTFIDTHGAGLDPYLRKDQTRYRLMEEIRALVAHAVVAESADADSERAAGDLVLKTFPTLQTFVMQLMNEGSSSEITFFQGAGAQPAKTT